MKIHSNKAMKFLFFILFSFISFFVFGQQDSNIIKYAGTYHSGGETYDAAYGVLYIYPETDTTYLFYIENGKSAPSYNSGSTDGRARLIRKDSAVYSEDEGNCILYFKLSIPKIKVTEFEHNNGCGYGNGVGAGGIYIQTDKKIPHYYINRESDTIYFAKPHSK